MVQRSGRRSGCNSCLSWDTSLETMDSSSWNVRILIESFNDHPYRSCADTDWLECFSHIDRTILFDETWSMSSQWLQVTCPPLPTAWAFGEVSCTSLIVSHQFSSVSCHPSQIFAFWTNGSCHCPFPTRKTVLPRHFWACFLDYGLLPCQRRQRGYHR
jgi:hypothetical protein